MLRLYSVGDRWMNEYGTLVEGCQQGITEELGEKPILMPFHLQPLDCVWNVMAHAQKPDFVFRRNGRVHLNRQGHQFRRLLAAEVCASVVVILDSPSSEVMWRILATHSIRQLPLHFPSRASPCGITFQLDCTLRKGLAVTDQLLIAWVKVCFGRNSPGGPGPPHSRGF
jgi:hypothetical protein